MVVQISIINSYGMKLLSILALLDNRELLKEVSLNLNHFYFERRYAVNA